MQIIFKGPAENDVKEIFAWYNDQLEGLGNDFLDDLDATLPYLLNYPTSFRRRYKKVRILKLSRFPYLIYFTIEKEKFLSTESATRQGIDEN